MRKLLHAALAALFFAAPLTLAPTQQATATSLFDVVTKGSTDRSVTVDIIDSADGTPENAVVFNTSGIDLWYRREGAARTAITEATLAALTTAHTDGGFLLVSDGTYRVDLPDAAFATGANYVDFGGTVTGMIVIGGRVRLVDYNIEVANLAANVTQYGGTNGTFSGGRPEVNTTHAAGTAWGSGAITAASIATDAITAAKIAADAIGASEVANATIDAATFATAAIDAAAIAADAIGASEVAADAIGASEIAADAIGAAEVADGTLDNATYATTAGPMYALNTVDQGTAQAATGTTLQLRSAAAFADDELIGATAVITGGSAGVGQARTITDYVSSTDTATVANWTTTPTGMITYKVFADPPGAGGSVAISAGGISASSFAAGAIDASAIAADAIGASELATDAIGAAEIAADAIGASEVATDAIGAAELAANAVGAAEIASDALASAKFDSTAGSFYPLGIVDQGTAQAATGTTLQLRSAAAFADDEIIGATCVITGGSAGVGQARTINDYVSSTDTATVTTWTTTPTGTITYKCFGTSTGGGTVSIASGGITTSSFASGAIDAAAVAADAIGASELATDAIGAAEIAADAIGASEVATDAIGASELAASAIGASELADGGITATEFGSGAITATVIATDAIGAAEIADSAVDAGAIATDAITAAKIAADAIGASEVAADAIGAAEVANATIDAATFAAGAVDATAVATDAIGAAEIAADAIGASEVATDAIGAAELAANAVGAAEVATGAVDADALASDAVDEMWNIVIEDQGGGIVARCSLAAILAVVAGDVATTGTSSTFEDPSGTETRAASSQPTAGNRTVTITCPTY
jgi:hypothetical protein